jgi:hypothetical protein
MMLAAASASGSVSASSSSHGRSVEHQAGIDYSQKAVVSATVVVAFVSTCLALGESFQSITAHAGGALF